MYGDWRLLRRGCVSCQLLKSILAHFSENQEVVDAGEIGVVEKGILRVRWYTEANGRRFRHEVVVGVTQPV